MGRGTQLTFSLANPPPQPHTIRLERNLLLAPIEVLFSGLIAVCKEVTFLETAAYEGRVTCASLAILSKKIISSCIRLGGGERKPTHFFQT